jgi:hypothetical protein
MWVSSVISGALFAISDGMHHTVEAPDCAKGASGSSLWRVLASTSAALKDLISCDQYAGTQSGMERIGGLPCVSFQAFKGSTG